MNIFRVIDDGRFASKTVAWGPASLDLYGGLSGAHTLRRSHQPRLRVLPRHASDEARNLVAQANSVRAAGLWEDLVFIALGLSGFASIFVALLTALRR
jgi:hypothetical protein